MVDLLNQIAATFLFLVAGGYGAWLANRHWKR
jgi:hypothetical protein